MTIPATDRVPAVSGIPAFGLGTWQNTDPEACTNSVKRAIEMGYRHIDTAQVYENEQAVGKGIAQASVSRDELFIATKVWIDNLAHDDVIESTKESLSRLQLDTVDLLYVHWPAGAYDPEETLPAFDELYSDGYINGIGVSNFEPRHLDQARDILDTPIMANQVECHPMLQQPELRKYADQHGHALVAYSPLARGGVFENDTIVSIAESHGVSAAQVSIAWLLEQGTVPIPKATSKDHIEDNYEALTLELSNEEIERINNISERERKVDPDFAPW